MGSTLCSADLPGQQKPDVFSYVYGEDNREIKIVHTDTIQSSKESIRPQLADCEAKLKRSEKRFLDVTVNSEPILLACGGRELHCTFERPEVFLKPEASLFYKIYRIVDAENCKPSNIVVGNEIMQYFGVFLCYLSNNPELISRIILTNRNSYGICAVEVIHDGRREVVFIDDYILCHNKRPLFSNPVKYSDMWPCLLEKAWFKIKSSLKTKIHSAHPFQVFTTFLSYPMKRFQLNGTMKQNREIIGKYIIKGQTYGKGFGCILTSHLQPNHKIGLSGRKHFYFLRVLQYRGKFYFYLRNPCGHFDFRGSLYELSKQLETEVVRITGQQPVPGNFLLAQEEFDQQIESFFIVQYNPSSSISSEEQISFANTYNAECYVKFKITKKGEVGIRLQQLCNTQQCAPLTYLLLDVERKAVVSGLTNEEGCFGVPQTNLLDNLHEILLPGTYILRIKKKSHNKSQNLRTRDRLIVTGNQTLTFEKSEAGQLKNEFVSEAKEIVKKKLSQERNSNRDQIQHKVLWMGDIVVIYINKLNSGKEAINLQVNFPDLANLQCLTHEISRGYTSLPPFQKDMLIVFEKINLTESTSLGRYNLTPY